MVHVYRLTDPRDVGAAWHYIDLYMSTLKLVQGLEQRITKPPLPLRVDREAAEAYKEAIPRARVALKTVDVQIRAFVSDRTTAYPYIDYLLSTPLPKVSLVAFIATPPDLTWGKPPYIHSGTWITTTFFVVRRQDGIVEASKLKRFFTRVTYITRVMQRGMLLSKYPAIERFYEKKVAKYVAEGRREAHARALAGRDIVRIFIGNAWLVATLTALERSLIKPEEVDIPYWLAENPRLHLQDMIDPAEASKTPYRWRDYTWRRLLEEVGLL